MRKEIIISALSVFALAGISACGNTEKTEQITSEIEAAQMQGREAARWYLHQNVTDSVSAAQAANKARTRKFELEKAGKKKEAEAFDSAFVKTVRAVDKTLLLPE